MLGDSVVVELTVPELLLVDETALLELLLVK
jgi:hypothetical protein